MANSNHAASIACTRHISTNINIKFNAGAHGGVARFIIRHYAVQRARLKNGIRARARASFRTAEKSRHICHGANLPHYISSIEIYRQLIATARVQVTLHRSSRERERERERERGLSVVLNLGAFLPCKMRSVNNCDNHTMNHVLGPLYNYTHSHTHRKPDRICS